MEYFGEKSEKNSKSWNDSVVTHCATNKWIVDTPDFHSNIGSLIFPKPSHESSGQRDPIFVDVCVDVHVARVTWTSVLVFQSPKVA